MSRANLEIAVVKYTGTGAVSYKSDWTTLPPICALLKKAGTAMALATPAMNGVSSYPATLSANLSNVITQIGDGGIVLGTSANVNAAATTYYGLVIAARGSEAVYTGRYRGTGVAGNVQSGHFPFAPDIVMVKCATHAIAGGAMRTSDMASATCLQLGAADAAAGLITGLLADGITLGTSTTTNGAIHAYDYLSLRAVSGAIAYGTYTGTGAAQSISGAGFAPDAVLIKALSQTTPTGAVFATGDMIADGAFGMDITNGSGLASAVLSMDADGFGLGTGAEVNESGRTYYYVAFKAGEHYVDLSRTEA